MRVHNESPESRSSPPREAAKLSAPVLGAEMKGAPAPMEPSGNNSSLEVAGCAGSPCPQGCTLHVATCVGVHPTVPPRFPSCDSYHVPHDGWTHSSVLSRLTSSSCHPGRPGTVACQASLDVSFQDQRSTASQQTTPGCAMCAGMLAVELIEEVWANARGICGSAGALPQPRASAIS